MQKQAGFTVVELLLVAITALLLAAIVAANFRDAVVKERRSLAQQALVTSAGLQERWFIRLYQYANTIDQVGGATAAGDYYVLQVTQDPCGNTSCFTITATAIGEQEKDRECGKMSINYLGVRRAVNYENEDTSKACWEDNV